MEAADNLLQKLIERKQSSIYYRENAAPEASQNSTTATTAPEPQPSAPNEQQPSNPPSSKPDNQNPSTNRPPRRPDNPYDIPLMGYPGIPVPIPVVNTAPTRKKINRTDKIQDPDSCSTFDEQVSVIADNIRIYTITGRADKAVKVISDWYDGVVDGKGKFYDDTRSMLNGISKANLINLLEALIRFAG